MASITVIIADPNHFQQIVRTIGWPNWAIFPSRADMEGRMADVLDYAPVAATVCAIPQFVPQLMKLRRTGDTAGVSWPWATLTSVNNAAWAVYFMLSRYRTALVPACAATLLAGVLAAMLTTRGKADVRSALLTIGWAALLTAACIGIGRSLLGALLTAGFLLQITPPVWAAYRTDRPTGISRGTWLLILAELSCWAAFGVHESDPRLMVLGFTGIAAGLLMLLRLRRTRGNTAVDDPDALTSRPMTAHHRPLASATSHPTTPVNPNA
jgi:hypothetical protein